MDTPHPADAIRSGEAVDAASIAKRRRDFLAHARHELRTPLNAILGYSELLIEELTDCAADVGGIAADVRRIHRSGESLLALVNALFDPGAIERAAAFDFEAYRARITHDLRTPLTAAIGYCEMLLEEHEGDGEPAQTIRSELQRIHSAGRRLLALTDDLLRRGESELALPADPVRPIAAARSLAPEQAVVGQREQAARSPASGAGARLLVVDDNEMNRDLLVRRLRRQGHTVVALEDGRQALECARAEPFDLVLLDVLMPGLNGYETLREFKSEAALRDIPVIMISALDEMDSVVRCIELGAEEYLPKTFDPVLLRARIGACLEKKALRDREKDHLARIEAEKRRADELLRVILPEPIVRELEATNTVRPRLCDDVAVLFCDIVGFTPYCAGREPETVITHLQALIERYEQIALDHGVQKIKTIGDSFMGAVGLLEPAPDAADRCVRCGLKMVSEARRSEAGWQVRVGIHIGPVVAGVVGRRQYLFDLWGDTVNTAARVESHGANDAVNVSATAWERIARRYAGASLGRVPLKGIGEIEVYRVEGARNG